MSQLSAGATAAFGTESLLVERVVLRAGTVARRDGRHGQLAHPQGGREWSVRGRGRRRAGEAVRSALLLLETHRIGVPRFAPDVTAGA